MGIFKPKPKPTPAPVQQAPAATEETPQQVTDKKEEERRKRLLAMNADGPTGQMTPAAGVTGQATTARKKLLGL